MNVSQIDSENRKLGTWVSRQRAAFKKGNLGKEQIDRLNSLGFLWDHGDDVLWEEKFQKLVMFKKKYGHANVPFNSSENKKLGIWVANQRATFKKGMLEKKRVDRLNEIGFIWSLRG